MDDTLDRYGLAEHVSPAAYGVLQRLEQTLRRDIRPLLADAWERAELPHAFSETLVRRWIDLIGAERCDGCIYYLEPTAELSYCWHPKLRILVGAAWWCQWWEAVPDS